MATLHVPSHEECGFVGTPTTPARAAAALRRHSCERHRLLAESRARRSAAAAAVDRTPKPCLHKKARHRHGTYACSKLDGCNCWPCGRARSAYETRRLRQEGYGRWRPFVPAGPAAAHVRELMDAGIGLRRITELSGVPRGVLWKLVYGKRGADGTQRPSRRIRPETEQRLLQVETCADSLAGGVLVDATGTRRRLQALIACGWSAPRLARHLAMTSSNFEQLLGRSRVTKATAARVGAVYDQLWASPPPQRTPAEESAAAHARERARRLGWAPPMAWDDDTIDDPAAQPDLGQRVRRSKLPPADDLRFLLDAGESEDMIARRFGVTLSAVKQALQRDRAEQAKDQERHTVDGDAEVAA